MTAHQEMFASTRQCYKELLAQQFISDIIVDGSNNKWISTADAGVFYVSSDGQNTIHHFTKDNSPLPSNGVNAMALDSENGVVYFGTNRGLVSFATGGSRTMETLEDIYVYPVVITSSTSNICLLSTLFIF